MHSLYNDEGRWAHATATGIIQEFDAANVLLDIARRNPNLAVLPAPLQFEHVRKRTNVDFVIFDLEARRAIGVQVKSNIFQEDFEKADSERVVFLEGNADLGNVRAVRVSKNRSTVHVKSWPGIISAKRVDAIPTTGRYANHSPENPATTMLRKLQARELVGHLKVDWSGVTKMIGERILEKL